MSTPVRFALAVVLLAVPLSLQAQTCDSIPNFAGTSDPGSFTITWAPPPNVSGTPVYEILEDTGTDYTHYCTNPSDFFVIATTTSTTYTQTKTTANIVYGAFVRLQSNPCQTTPTYLVTDSFTNPPSKPPVPVATIDGNTVALTFSYSDPHAVNVHVYRAGADGKYVRLDRNGLFFDPSCVPDPKTFIDSNVPAGVYDYRLVAENHGSTAGLSGVVSDPFGVSVQTVPKISFNASPLTIRQGQSATLSCSIIGASSVFIDQGIGNVPLPGAAATVTPKTTTTYTLTAVSGNATATGSVTVNVLTAPLVAAGALPTAMVQTAGSGGGTTTYTLSNAGGSPTTITLRQNGTFFTQSPSSFTIQPGGSQVITVTGTAQPAGFQSGSSIPTGAGVPEGMQIPIRLAAINPPAGRVVAKASKNRVDVAGLAGANPIGTVDYVNSGTTTLQGVLHSDVPWIIPQSGVVTIPPGATGTFTFTIDRAQRPDSNTPTGSSRGSLVLSYLSGALSKTGSLDTTTPSVSTVTVVDTVKLPVSSGVTPPPLAPNEVALFVPGVGHLQGSVGLFVSDLSVLNPIGTHVINDLKMYYTPVGSSITNAQSAPLPSVSSTVSVALADVAQNVFGNTGQVASLQIRSADAASLAVNANIFNSSNPAGTFGTAIPTFRSDRAVAAGDHLVLTGLRSDSSTHTNLFIQETSGANVTVQTQFFDVNGNSLGTRSDVAGPFALAQFNNAVPSGAASAILTNTGATPGKFLAYATPVDNNSGDNWAVADWARQNGDTQDLPTVIPVAGSALGANSTFFRTDLAVMNTSTSSASGTLTYLPRGGTAINKTISLGAHQTSVIPDVVGTFFGQTSSLGFLTFTPVTGTFAVTSRTFSTDTSGVKPGTFGTAVPAIANADALVPGSYRAIGALDDAAPATVLAGRPATFRTNMGLVETSGAPVTVRVTLRFTFQLAKVAGIASASKDYALTPFQFMQVPMVSDIIGDANRATLPDLHDIEVDFQVLSGPGTAAVYTSSTDNGTGDIILRTQ